MSVPASSNPVYAAVPQLGRLREEVLFGDVWLQPEMSQRDRSVVTCSVLAVLGKTEELKVHLGRAIDNGVTVDELRGLIVQVAMYAGWPCAVGAAGGPGDLSGSGLDLFAAVVALAPAGYYGIEKLHWWAILTIATRKYPMERHLDHA